MTPDADVIVVGLGVHGSATAASLARRGRRVVGLERFARAHARGSSHGRTRMIRRAYPNPVWNDLVDRAYAGWAALEAESGRVLVQRTGGLYAHTGHGGLQGPDCIAVDDPDEMRRLMPGFAVPSGHGAVYDPAAGMLEAASGLDALQESALAHGAELRFGERLEAWEQTDEGVLVRTDRAEYLGRRVVLATGSFAEAVVPQLSGLLEVWRILTLTVPAGQPIGMPTSLGAFAVDRPEGLLFGIPDAAGNGVKVGIDARRVWDPERPVQAPDADEIDELRSLLADYVPGIDTTPVEAAACLYTMTEDKRFIIGPLAETPDVVVVSACSGHGFKFGPAIGDAAADLADGIARPDLDFISTARRGI